MTFLITFIIIFGIFAVVIGWMYLWLQIAHTNPFVSVVCGLLIPLSLVLSIVLTAYYAQASTVDVRASVPCTLDNMRISNCVPEDYYQWGVMMCTYGND